MSSQLVKIFALMEVAGIADAIENYNNWPWAKLPKITTEEKITIVNSIKKHSQKDIYSDDPFVELLKDVDSLDRYLHGVKTEGAYLKRSLRVYIELKY